MAESTAGPPLGANVPSGGSAVHAVTSVGAGQFSAGPPQGELAPSGGSAVHAVTSVGASATETVHLVQRQDYQFEMRFGPAAPSMLADEPPPLGQGAGPSPVQLLAAAVGNCLSDSLLFALRKFHQKPEPIRCDVAADVGRGPQGRLRVLGLRADLTLGVPAAALERLDRVLAQFEDFCTVTQSVGAAIPVTVTVRDADGLKLK